MIVEIQEIWSPDLEPEGLPADTENYHVFMQVCIGERGAIGGEVFNFKVCSRSAFDHVQSGTFVSHVLVLEPFNWSALEARLMKLLHHADSCTDWDCVIKKLAGFLRYSDE